MTERPYVILSSAVSVDGCLDGTGVARLVLSGSADLDRVDAERAAADAIMVGAGTIRRDDPRLLVRSAARRAGRRARGLPASPARVTLTASGDIDPAARFLSADPGGADPGGADPGGAPEGAGTGSAGPGGAGPHGTASPSLVYCASPVVARTRRRLASLAEVLDAGERPALEDIVADLSRRGARRLLVEGGADLGRRFLTAGLADELHLVIAPFFVGDPAAPRFAGPGVYPHGPSNPMVLAEAQTVGEVVLLRYLLKSDGHGGGHG